MRRRPRSDGQRGAVLVELAMVSIPLMILMLGVIEVGGAWRDKSVAIQSSRQGARVVTASNLGTDDLADQQALLAALANLPGPGSGSLRARKIVIYDADLVDPYDSTTGPYWNECFGSGAGELTPKSIETLPAGGAAARGQSAVCNVYLGGNADKNNLDPADILSGHWDASPNAWNTEFRPSHRIATIGSATAVGVYVELYRPYVTNLLPGPGMIVSGATVMVIEPPAP